MNMTTRISIMLALLVVVGITMAIKQKTKETPNTKDQFTTTMVSESRSAEAANSKIPTTRKALPRLVDLGAGRCIPCKKMAPILEELKKEFVGRMDVEFIDVWVNPSAGNLYGIKLIPTQIFYNAYGKELFRHEGFYSREDILGKWKELGMDFSSSKPVS